MEYYVHFKSSIPVVVCVNGNEIGFTENKNDTLSIKTDETNLIATIHPIEEFTCCHISYSVNLKLQNKKIFTESASTEIYNYGDENFEVVFNPPSILTNLLSHPIFTQKIDEKTTVSVYDFGIINLKIQTDNQTFSYNLNEKLENINIKNFDNKNNKYIILTGKTQDNLHFLAVFCNFFCNLQIKANEIDFDNSKIEAITNLSDIAEQAIVQQFKITDYGFKKVDEFLIFLNKKPFIEKNPTIIPWAFMEAINFENIPLAKQYLSSELLEILDEKHIKSFFGNYKMISWDKYKNGPLTICLFNEPNEKCRKYKFEIEKNKIINITELDW